jgi:hypothetical protein
MTRRSAHLEKEGIVMHKAVIPGRLNENDFSQLLEMAWLLIRKGFITKKQAEITLQRIASENELTPIYL